MKTLTVQLTEDQQRLVEAVAELFDMPLEEVAAEAISYALRRSFYLMPALNESSSGSPQQVAAVH